MLGIPLRLCYYIYKLIKAEVEKWLGIYGENPVVDLSTGEIKEEPLEEKCCRDFLGCYGIGARILYSR